VLAFAMLVAAGIRAGWQDGPDRWRWTMIAGAAVCWLLVLAPWAAGSGRWTAMAHQRGMYAALVAWAVTDVAVAVAWGT
jgi:hypothetical protein